ncbi:hypothetical protein DYL59_07725 [Pseudomonas kairouanensis]|uniref:Uncharacterized protein n=1 Tax=Pseudomonas kairouanensis TaxID=2293832 RepID=A0A4Z0AWY4_9PSED|nr:hypothetical protein DYL59_07725 [Pseudomonas kairouanensis]
MTHDADEDAQEFQVGQGVGHKISTLTVGASLLAKIVNDHAGNLEERGTLRFFASKLAPTRIGEFTPGISLEKSELSICPCRFFRFHTFRRIGP